MSSAGQAIGGLVGAVIGAFAGNPMLGFKIGMVLGGLLDPPKVLGPRLDDLAVQTSTYGVFIQRDYGTVASAGNVFWIQGDSLIERSVESSGKGGPITVNFDYFATFAVGLCEGPIDGVRRIWIGGQLWYDAGSDDLSSIIVSNENAGIFTLYTGTDTQEADPLIQADRGAANVPAYRGLAYIVFEELPLKDYGNSLAAAQVKVEIVMSMSAKTPVELEAFNLYDPTWHATIKSAGNQHDQFGGYRNLVAYTNSSPYPVTWYRSIGQSLVEPKVIANGSAFSCFPVCNSLNGLQYAWTDGNERACWGRFGRVSYIEFGTSQKVYAIADDGESAYILTSLGADGTRVTKVPLEDMTAEIGTPKLMSRIAYANHTLDVTSILCVWQGKAIVLHRAGSSTDHVLFQVYEEDVDGILSMSDSFSIDLDEPAYDINNSSSGVNIEGDTLTIGVVSGTGKGNVLVIDLTNKILIKKWYVSFSLAGSSIPTNGGFSVAGDMLFWGSRSSTAGYGVVCQTLYAGSIDTYTVALSSIIQAEVTKSDLLTAADIDVTELTDQVRGYRVSSLAPLRGGIDQLRKAWPFDAIQHGYQIKFKRRGGASVATITAGELDAREAGAAPGVQISNVREMDLILPTQLTMQYLDAVREYDVNTAEESR